MVQNASELFPQIQNQPNTFTNSLWCVRRSKENNSMQQTPNVFLIKHKKCFSTLFLTQFGLEDYSLLGVFYFMNFYKIIHSCDESIPYSSIVNVTCVFDQYQLLAKLYITLIEIDIKLKEEKCLVEKWILLCYQHCS